jgi:prepilin-type N-terminal cleavage/methylation domain-containing protein
MSERSRLTAVRGEDGFSLIEVMVATVIAVIAVMGLAHTFGTGRALINRYEVARDAVGVAQRELEVLGTVRLSSDSLNADVSQPVIPPFSVKLNDRQSGTVEWRSVWVDDPVDDPSGGGPDPDPKDYRRVTVVVRWAGAADDSVALSRFIMAP